MTCAASKDYERKYKDKHGVDLAKIGAGHESDPKFVPSNSDRDLLRDAVAAHVKDKTGFFEAVAKLQEKKTVSPLGELEELTVEGNSATGHAKVTIVPDVEGGESPLKPGQPPVVDDKPFKFRA